VAEAVYNLFVPLTTHLFLLHLQPEILTFVQKLLDAPRQTYRYSTDFTHLFSSDDEYMRYEKGLILLAGIFGGILILWGAILIGFACRGKVMGCASGRGFEPYKSREQEQELDQPSGSTDLDDDLNSWVGSVDGGNKQTNAAEGDEHLEGDESSATSLVPSDEDSMYAPSLSECSVDASVAPQPYPRERRTRIAFIIFSLVTLVCVPLALILTFVPLRDTAESSDDYLVDARGVVNEVRAAYSKITSATESSIENLERTPLDFRTICPQVAKADAAAVLRVDLDAIVQLLANDYAEVERAVSTNLFEVDQMLTQFEDGLHYAEIAYDEVKKYVWAVPGLLLGLSALTLATLIAVVMAWKRESSLRFQRLVSYGVLPLFIAFSVTCWVVTIAAAVSAAVSSDACSPGSSGSPDDTVRGILQAQGVNPNSIVFEFVTAYSRGCKGDDPTAIFNDVKSQLQTVVEYIWRNLSAVDSVGVSEITDLCGGDQLDGFLTSARDLARDLTTIRKAMEIADLALDCDRMNPLYVDALHDSMCTDIASASAWGFVLFFAIGLSTMSMITLRASWRHKIGEDRIYDESDVADNMIMDEHEEYLAYISKYKHEWQEYKGIDPHNRSPIDITDSTSESENSTGTRTGDGSGDEEQPLENREEPFDPYNNYDDDNVSSASTEDISFLSLREPQLEGDPAGDGQFIALPPRLLPLSHRIFIDSDDYEPVSPGQSYLMQNAGSSDVVYATAVRVESEPQSSFTFDEPGDYDGSIEVISPAKLPKSPTVTRSSSAGGGRGARPPPSPKRSNSKPRLSIDTSTRDDSDYMECIDTSVIPVNPPSASQSGFLTQPSPNRVQFFLDDDGEVRGPDSNVQRQVDHFTTQTRVHRPVTPPRLHPLKMKEMAAKFDSPPPAYRGGNNHGSSSPRRDPLFDSTRRFS
jgi:hypothetical protein